MTIIIIGCFVILVPLWALNNYNLQITLFQFLIIHQAIHSHLNCNWIIYNFISKITYHFVHPDIHGCCNVFFYLDQPFLCSIFLKFNEYSEKWVDFVRDNDEYQIDRSSRFTRQLIYVYENKHFLLNRILFANSFIDFDANFYFLLYSFPSFINSFPI